jgi:rhomboid protease GluP
MLSLYFIGPTVEIIYGKWRYLSIYLLAGIGGGLLFLFVQPGGITVGASGAIFGIFGALGVFYIANRRAIGGGAISNWLFWLGLNLFFGLSNGGINIIDHLGGLVVGIVLAFLLTPRQGRRV